MKLALASCWGSVRGLDDEVDQAVAELAATAMPSMQAAGLWVQAMNVAEDDIVTAIALYQRAIDTAVNCGCRILEETCRGFHLGLLAQTTDVDAALDGFSETVNAWQMMGDVCTSAGVAQLATLLARLGCNDGAARLYGATAFGNSADGIAPFHSSVLTVRDAMGPVAFTLAYEAGAALDPRSSGELAHRLIAQVRADRAQT